MNSVNKIKLKLQNKNYKRSSKTNTNDARSRKNGHGFLSKKSINALASLRGTVYEEKILNLLNKKLKSNKKEISKDEAEKILKESQNQELDTKKEQKR